MMRVRLQVAARGAARGGRQAVAAMMASSSGGGIGGGRGVGAAAVAAAPAAGTFSAQLSLPRLPVPPLAATVEAYLRTLEPFAAPEEMARVREMAKAFAADDGIGRKLQARLLERRDAHKDTSWLIFWWNSMMYMGYRDATVINVSYFYAFADDVNAWRMRSQAARAAGLVDEMLKRRDALVAETLPADTAGGKPLCMHMYKYLFNTCRVPSIPECTTAMADPATNNHILVIRKNKFYTVDVGPPSARLSPGELQAQLELVIALAGREKSTPIGVLTAEHRDMWSCVYPRLLAAHPDNEVSMKVLQSAVLAVCLDDTAPKNLEELSRGLWHGDGRNRWFDSTLQFIVFENGKAGMLGEHSMSDGMPTATLTDSILKSLEKKTDPAPAATRALPAPRELIFRLNSAVEKQVQSAELTFDEMVADHDLRVLAFTKYGRDAVKDFGLSPDAWCQMAIQLAYYRNYGTYRATYEPAQMRTFLRGRTETIRVVSKESVAFVKRFGDRGASAADKVAALAAACKQHVSYARTAASGHGLRMLLLPGESAEFLFTDLDKRARTWYISTSNLSSEYYVSWGWGEVVPDGIGVAYSTQTGALRFNCTARKVMKIDGFVEQLERALVDMSDAWAAAKPSKL